MITFAWCLVIPWGATENDGLVSLFEAIRTVETGGMDTPHDAVGDGGRSIGPYQISRAYWVDSGVCGDWKRCRDRKFAEAAILAYWRRYCPQSLSSLDFETLARVHNGGPQGHRRASTLPYWKMIRARLAKMPTARWVRSTAVASVGVCDVIVQARGERYGQEVHGGERRGVIGAPARRHRPSADWRPCQVL